jgi:hypothetical protein
VGAAGRGTGDAVEPIREAGDVHGGRGGEVLQVGLGQAAIAGLPQPEGAGPLGERALDPGPRRLLGGELGRLLPLPRRLDGLVLGP